MSSNASISINLGDDVFTTHSKHHLKPISDRRNLFAFLLSRTDFEAPATTVTATKDEMMFHFREMLTMRRMEITCDTEYKVHVVSMLTTRTSF